MKKIPFTQAQFIASAFNLESFPSPVNLQGTPLPEVALVGRSNVGKSSLINNLLRNKTLAKTSSTPGKTQSVNFFTVNDQLTLVDLPGYGYAKTCKKIRKTWAPLIDAYLEERSNLKLILLLIDSRRELNEEDQALIDWALFRQIPLLLIFTKSDKLSVSEKIHHERRFAKLANLYYSVKDPAARIALIETINLQLNTHGTHQ